MVAAISNPGRAKAAASEKGTSKARHSKGKRKPRHNSRKQTSPDSRIGSHGNPGPSSQSLSKDSPHNRTNRVKKIPNSVRAVLSAETSKYIKSI